jgi:hypothetical protein
MKIPLPSLLSLALALVLPSCLEVETEITVNKDGSGTITDEMVMSAQAVGMMEMAAAQGGQQKSPFADMKDEAKLKEKAKAYGEGVTFSKTEDIKRNDGSKGVRVIYKFTDINKVTFNPSSGMSDIGNMKPGGKAGAAIDEAKDAKATFAYADSKLTITLPQPEGGEAVEKGSPDESSQPFDPNDPQMSMMTEMMRGMKMSGKVTLAEGIAETNATHHEGNSITLFEINFDELMKNPDSLKVLSGLEKMSPAEMAETLKKVKGAKVETQKKVTATSK